MTVLGELHCIAVRVLWFEYMNSFRYSQLNCLWLQVLHVSQAVVEMTEPYLPGFLAFREVDFLLDRLKEIEKEHPQFYPQASDVSTMYNHSCMSKGSKNIKMFLLPCFTGFSYSLANYVYYDLEGVCICHVAIVLTATRYPCSLIPVLKRGPYH